jgi:SH3-like domain-containing protein
MSFISKWLFRLVLVGIFCFSTEPVSALNERMCVNVPIANIRSGPGETYNVIWQVEKYFPILVIEKKGMWYRFRDFEKDEGWIHKSLVTNDKCVITKKSKCNLRSGPSTTHNLMITLEKGIPFKVVKQKGVWLYIEHSDGDRGWIHKSLAW